MGKKNKLKKPTLAGSKTVIGFSVVMLLLFVGMAYLASHIQPARSRRPDSPQIPIYFERARTPPAAISALKKDCSLAR